MAMTNAQIIFNESMELMSAGLIGTTGNSFDVELEDGSTRTIYEPEPIHTFARWKECGRQVKKGEHAIAAFMIWKYCPGGTYKDKKTGEEKERQARTIMKKAFFFKFDQTEPVKEKGGKSK